MGAGCGGCAVCAPPFSLQGHGRPAGPASVTRGWTSWRAGGGSALPMLGAAVAAPGTRPTLEAEALRPETRGVTIRRGLSSASGWRGVAGGGRAVAGGGRAVAGPRLGGDRGAGEGAAWRGAALSSAQFPGRATSGHGHAATRRDSQNASQRKKGKIGRVAQHAVVCRERGGGGMTQPTFIRAPAPARRARPTWTHALVHRHASRLGVWLTV